MTHATAPLRALLLAVLLVLGGILSTHGVTMAATSTVTIPLTTLSVGSHQFGPTPIDTTVSDANLSLSRTAGTHSLNAAAPSTTVTLQIQQSFDGGATFFTMCSNVIPGGTLIGDGGIQETDSYIDCSFPAEGSSNRQARAIVTVSGAPVSVSGFLTLS